MTYRPQTVAKWYSRLSSPSVPASPSFEIASHQLALSLYYIKECSLWDETDGSAGVALWTSGMNGQALWGCWFMCSSLRVLLVGRTHKTLYRLAEHFSTHSKSTRKRWANSWSIEPSSRFFKFLFRNRSLQPKSYAILPPERYHKSL